MNLIRKLSLFLVLIFALTSFITVSNNIVKADPTKAISGPISLEAPASTSPTQTQSYYTYNYDFYAVNQAPDIYNIGVNQFSFNPGIYTQLHGVGTTQLQMWRGGNIFSDRGSPDAYVLYKFDGVQVKLYGEKGSYCGITEVTILNADGQVEIPAQNVDFYQSYTTDAELCYTSAQLQPGIHQIKIRITGEANPNNKTMLGSRPNWTINLYSIDVITDKIATPTPKPIPTSTPISPTDPAYYELSPKPVKNRNPLIATTCVEIKLGSASANQAAILDLIDRTAVGVKEEKGQYPDIIVLSEGILSRELGSYSQRVPGPYSNAIAEKCKQYNTYICLNVLENCADGKLRNCNTLIDREGKIVGKYYKVKIPPEEIPYTEPGTEYRVFQTEFGMIGMMVCYDLDSRFNEEVVKALKGNGAELILASSIGDYIQQAKEASTNNNIAMVVAGQEQYAGSAEPISSIYASTGERLAGITDRTAAQSGDNGYRPGSGSYAAAFVNLGEFIPIPTPTTTTTITPTPTTLTGTPTPTAGTPIPIATTTPTETVITTAQVTFPDVNADNLSWAVNEIQTLATMGIISGTTADGTTVYNPFAQITRAELTKLIVETFSIDGSGTDADFGDVASGSWYYEYVGAAFKSEIIMGTSNTTFDPDAPVTRQDMASIIIRAMIKYKSITTVSDDTVNAKLEGFADAAEISDYAKVNVATAVELEIIKGTKDDGPLKFKPFNQTNRAEAAVVIYRMLFKNKTKHMSSRLINVVKPPIL